METKYNYKLIQQHMTSDRLGNCEICGEFVSDVYSQTRTHIKTIGGEGHEIYDGNAFGHKECLIGIRKIFEV